MSIFGDIHKDTLLSEITEISDIDSRVTTLEGAGGGGSHDHKPFLAIDSTGNQEITGTPATVNIDSISLDDDNYTLANDEITIVAAGDYEVSIYVAVDITSSGGATRGALDVWLESDDGGAYAVVPGSYARDYIRESTGGGGSGTTFPLSHTNGNKKVRLRAEMSFGVVDVDTKQNFSKVYIKKL
jgi:hypothetical protein